MGIASVFVLSSLLLSPLAMAEESQAFVARNAELAAVHQEARDAVAAHQADAVKDAKQNASKVNRDANADS
jgi:type VI protein secretion system component VasA